MAGTPAPRRSRRASTAFLGVFALLLSAVACAGAESQSSGAPGDSTPTSAATRTPAPSDGDAPTGAASQAPTSEAPAWVPDRPVTFLVPGNPGGGGDILFRNLQSFMQEAHPDVTVQVVNRPGAGTAIAYTELKSNEGDPHILSLLFSGLITLPIEQEVSYVWTDFTPIAITELDTQFLVLNADSPWPDFESYADHARQEGVMNVGVAGAASRSDISTRQLAEDLGVRHNPVYLQSGGDIMRALLAGDVDVAALSSQEFIGQVEAGDVIAALVLGEETVPIPPLDDVPVAQEVLGFAPDGVDFKGVIAAGGITDEQAAYWESVVTEWTSSDVYNEHIEMSLLLKDVITGDELTSFLQTFEDDYRSSS